MVLLFVIELAFQVWVPGLMTKGVGNRDDRKAVVEDPKLHRRGKRISCIERVSDLH